MHRRKFNKHGIGAAKNCSILSGKLHHCLADLNEQAQVRLELIIRQMKEAEGINEGMKGADQMGWVRSIVEKGVSESDGV